MADLAGPTYSQTADEDRPAPGARAHREGGEWEDPPRHRAPADPAWSKLTAYDMLKFLAAVVDAQGLVAHNINAFNSFLSPEGMTKIIEQLFHIVQDVADERDQTEQDKLRTHIRIEIQFKDVRVTEPTYATYGLGQTMPLMPNMARLSGRTYSAQLSLGADLRLTAYYKGGHTSQLDVAIPVFQVSPIPIMVGSKPCHTSRMTREARKGIEEDPTDPGGYFIVKGGEWAVDWNENIAFNKQHVYLGMTANENGRGEFISQPGGAYENSSQIRIRSMKSGALTFEINSTEFKNARVPFYVLFRMFGMTSDLDVARTVAYDVAGEDPVTRAILARLDAAFQHHDKDFEEVHTVMDTQELITWMAAHWAPRFLSNRKAFLQVDSAVQYINERLLSRLDKAVLPHMGQAPDSRMRKLRFLGTMIRQIYLVELGVQMPTDRDSLVNKRVHGPGTSPAKALKTHFNSSVVGPAVRALVRAVRTTSFEELKQKPGAIQSTFYNSMAAGELHRALEQSYTAGDKATITVKQQSVRNRLATTSLERKNSLNVLSSERNISVTGGSQASKATKRAELMRLPNASFPGYVCAAQSADTGEKVGMVKQFAITAIPTAAGDALPLKELLYQDADLIPTAKVELARIAREGLSRVLVNGEPVGYCRAAHEFVARYRARRRAGASVDVQTSIVWNVATDDVDFWLDAGRLTRPLFIVYSNIVEFKAECRAAKAEGRARRLEFDQWIDFGPADAKALAAGRLTIDALRRRGAIEWLTAEEAENCLYAPSVQDLAAARHDYTRQYTNCDVPQAIFGLATLTSPYANHTQPARVTYQTNQGRQACGWYSLAYAYRVGIDQNRFFQHYIGAPIVTTVAYRWLFPNSANVMVASMVYRGFNQEDSVVLGAAPVARGMFAGTFYRSYKVELERGEEFGTPDLATSKNLKPNARYDGLVDGFPRVGARVTEGDILIGRYAKPTTGKRGEAAEVATDRSLVYRLAEPAVVVAVNKLRGPNETFFGVVKVAYDRPIGVGDKISNRQGNKGIIASIVPAPDMPYDDDGVSPQLIINPPALPSRMTVGQVLEGEAGAPAAAVGAGVDGTAFLPVDVDHLARRMREAGFRYNGMRTLYSGLTGEPYLAAIGVTQCAYQRLSKFARDDEYSVGSSGARDALTGQPLDGKNAHGGLRIGEMEVWVLEAHGAAFTLCEKLRYDSDAMYQHLCRGCGLAAVFNPAQGRYKCQTCGPAADIATVDSGRASIAFQHEVRSVNIVMRQMPRPYEFEAAE